MISPKLACLAAALTLATMPPNHALASEPLVSGPVTTASLPLPLPDAIPMPPNRVRSANPFVLPMTGVWRFSLTRGEIARDAFLPDGALTAITASSSQTGHSAQQAFDGNSETRWIAGAESFPQWIQADLGAVQHVTGIHLTLVGQGGRFQYRVEGSTDSQHWTLLADHTAAPGDEGGDIALTAADARYVRLTFTGHDTWNWASVTEMGIRIAGTAGDMVWSPTPDPAAVRSADVFASPAFDDRLWHDLAVPSNWEMAGYSLPTYNSVDDTVGLYRRWVAVPRSFAGRRIVWRFDGALDGAEIFVNGRKAGYHESGYTAFDVDVTDLVRPGQRNLFAVRVSKTTPSLDADTGDYQCLGGIYRETSLIAVPTTHIRDLTVRTPLDASYRNATLEADVEAAGPAGEDVSVIGSLYRSDGRPVDVHLAGAGRIDANGSVVLHLSAPVLSPALWTAETPNLYYLVLTLSHGATTIERVEQRFGFRQVEIKNGVLLWNGRPIKLAGTCRHDVWASKGYALTDREWLQDLALMQGANINAIRTSHYNHAARFMELCDEKGFYVLDEVPFCWIGAKSNDPAFAPTLLRRAADTLGRDKNLACVLAWSLGNESGVGAASQTVIDYVAKADPTRPAYVSGGGSWGPKGQAFDDRHYPTPEDVDKYLAGPKTLPALFSEQPHTFSQKESVEFDPGAADLWSEAMIANWNKVWANPSIAGSFIWEWQNQGIADRNADRTTDLWYGPDHLRDENNKGVVDSYRNPKPELWAVKMVYSPVVAQSRTVRPSSGTCSVGIENRYAFTNLSALGCHWTVLNGTRALRQGNSRIECAPGRHTVATFPAAAGMTALKLSFTRKDGSSVVDVLLPVTGAPTPPPPAAVASADAPAIADTQDVLRVAGGSSEIAFDKHTGQVLYWRVKGRDLLAGSPELSIGQGRGHTGGADKYFYGPAPLTDAATVAATPGDDGVHVTVTSKVLAGAGGAALGNLIVTYDIGRNSTVKVGWTLDWTADEKHLWAAGLRLPVASIYRRMTWYRDNDFTLYPPGHLGELFGHCYPGDVRFQASKRMVHWLSLTDGSAVGVAVLPLDGPLVTHGGVSGDTLSLCADSEVGPPQYLTTPWVADHMIVAKPGTPLSGSFVLEAVGP